MDERSQTLKDAADLWQAIHRALQSGGGVTTIQMNRLHWRAGLQELEILRNELAELKRHARGER